MITSNDTTIKFKIFTQLYYNQIQISGTRPGSHSGEANDKTSHVRIHEYIICIFLHNKNIYSN